MEAADFSWDKYFDLRQRAVSRSVACQVALQMARGSFRTLHVQPKYAQSVSNGVASSIIAESTVALQTALVFLVTVLHGSRT